MNTWMHIWHSYMKDIPRWRPYGIVSPTFRSLLRSLLGSRLSGCHATLRDVSKDGCEGDYAFRNPLVFLGGKMRESPDSWSSVTKTPKIV